jgi:diguanylate cyclase (GGDEF)-like protein
LGHDVGDKLLQMVASSIKEVIRGEDLFFRFGGDEFVILLSYIKKENIVKNIKNFAKRVQAIFEKPFIINGHKIYSSTSMGASIFPQDSDKIDDILRFADKAMYISKKENLGEIKFHHELQKERNDYTFGQKKEFQGEYLIKDTV